MEWTLPDAGTLQDSLEFRFRNVGVSPYGTRVAWLPGREFILEVVLEVSEPRPNRPMHIWKGDETGTNLNPAPEGWAAPLGELDVDRCAAAGRILQSYPSRLVLGTLLAASCMGMDSVEAWQDTPHDPNSWLDVKGAWFRDVALRLTARVLHGAYYVAGSSSDDPLRRALYNADSPTALRALTGEAASPGTYVWPLNMAAKIATFPAAGERDVSLDAVPTMVIPLLKAANPFLDVLPEPDWQPTYTTSIALPQGFQSTIRDLADVIRGVRTSLGVLAAVAAFVPAIGLLVAVILAVVVVDDEWKAAADTIESAAYDGVDPNEALARLLEGIGEVCDLVDDLDDVASFFSGDDPDIHLQVTGMDRGTLKAFAKSLREGTVVYPYHGSNSDIEFERLEEVLITLPEPPPPSNDIEDYTVFILDFAMDYYGNTLWANSEDGGLIEPESLSILTVPIVRTSDTARDFYFDHYQPRYAPTGGNEWQNGDAIAGLTDNLRVLDDERQRWAELASPTLQFMGALRLATVMLRELIHCEMPPLVLADLASLTGPLADAIRAELADSEDTACLVEILGGTSVAHALAAYWRQVVIDWFLLTYAQSLGVHEQEGDIEENLDRAAPGLFELICWMRTPEKREVLRSLLGTLDADRQGQPVRTGGLLADLLMEARSGRLCDAWSALDCTQREALTSFITGLGCEPEFFDEDFDLGQPDNYAGLTDAEPGADRDWPPEWLSYFDDSPWNAEKIDLYLATGLRASPPPGLAWAARVVERLPPVDTTRLASLATAYRATRVAWAPGWAWP